MVAAATQTIADAEPETEANSTTTVLILRKDINDFNFRCLVPYFSLIYIEEKK